MSLLFQTPRALAGRALRLVRPDARSPLAGRTVLITGASSGIGEATAYAVARLGARLILVARRSDELARVATEAAALGAEVDTFTLDLTDADAVEAALAQITEKHGAVDYLVNNAGRSIRRSLDLSYDRMHDFERTMAINYFGPVRLILGVLPEMRAQRFGHVVNVVTWGVQMKAPKFSAYIASKAALDTFSRIAGRETFGDNVTFTNLRLPLVRTGMITATEAYRSAPALTVDQAAAKVVRALEDRPLTLSVPVAVVGEIANFALPRLTDALAWLGSSRYPDSTAARGANDRATSPTSTR
ncbi:SDR family NAD(P)-dependent oxidoreductase [Nocardioides sp. Bht2]|uniref:SDR family NAD(P)-dependent oxidoreductase n=1 Tax=Nocardioides sp. Bht2 TaxID=3392297 RepID=UPI0039B3FE13